MRSVAILGAGSFGTALAVHAARAEREVVLWARRPELATEMAAGRLNPDYLPGVELPARVVPTADLAAVAACEVVLVAVPSHGFREAVRALLAVQPAARPAVLVSATKGIEVETQARMSEVVFEEGMAADREVRYAVLSGPSFAAEVARQAPTAVVVASRSPAAAQKAQNLFQSRYFRVYTNADVLGVGLGGALKNVIAIGAGVGAGLGFGHNAIAAVVTRGLAEITRLGLAMGAERSTFMGLAGLGDLVLTCTGPLSRNRTVGYRLGQGESLQRILQGMAGVPEGVETVRAVMELARRHDVEMPISEEVHAMLSEGRSPRTALENLMSREPKPEDWS